MLSKSLHAENLSFSRERYSSRESKPAYICNSLPVRPGSQARDATFTQNVHPPAEWSTRRGGSGACRVFFEDPVLGAEVFDDFLVLAVASAGQDGEQEMPGLEDEVHGGPVADVGTRIASGLIGRPVKGLNWPTVEEPQARPPGLLQLG